MGYSCVTYGCSSNEKLLFTRYIVVIVRHVERYAVPSKIGKIQMGYMTSLSPEEDCEVT